MRLPVKQLILEGGRQGLKSGFSLLVIMVPVSFIVAILNWTGLMEIISTAISPAFKYFGLPGSAALAYVSGALLNCYSAIAIMITLPLSPREITILALMVLFFHNIPIEAMVQKRAGSSALFMVIFRFTISIAGGLCLNLIMPVHTVAMAAAVAPVPVHESLTFSAMIILWAGKSLLLIAKILVIIMGLMILNRFLEAINAMAVISRILTPVLKILGLHSETAFLFIVANTLGLAYGGGVILGQRAEGKITDKSIRELNVFISVCHSLLEDTLLFVAIGASAFWIMIPRIIAGGSGVWVYRMVKKNIAPFQPRD